MYQDNIQSQSMETNTYMLEWINFRKWVQAYAIPNQQAATVADVLINRIYKPLNYIPITGAILRANFIATYAWSWAHQEVQSHFHIVNIWIKQRYNIWLTEGKYTEGDLV